MADHHCTCEECERRRQQAGDEAFADMVVLAQFHPEWFHFGDDHVHHHDDHGPLANDDVCHHVDDVDVVDDMGFWD